MAQPKTNNMNRINPALVAFFSALPYHLSGLPALSTSPKDFHRNGKHLNPRQLRRRMKRRGYHTLPNKSRRASAMKGFRMGRVTK